MTWTVSKSCGVIFCLSVFPLKNTDGQQQESKNKLFIQGTFKKHFLYTYYVPDT